MPVGDHTYFENELRSMRSSLNARADRIIEQGNEIDAGATE